MNIPVAGTITPNSLTLIVDGATHVLTEESHPNYAKIRTAWKTKDIDSIRSLLDLTSHLAGVMDGRVTVNHGVVELDGFSLDNTITDRIIEQHDEGFDAAPMCNFLANLHDNPSKQAVDELYLFLEASDLPITDDGCFIAYKMVRDDYKDNHTGTFDNSVGQILEMPRNQVDDRRNNTCSTGFHFCSQGYLGFYGGGGHVMVLKVNPRDVVSIPSDYENAKGRACRYEIVGEISKKVATTSHTFGTSVMNSDRIGENGVLYDSNARPWDGQFVAKRVVAKWFSGWLDDDLLEWCGDNNIETAEVDDKTVIVWRTRYESEFGLVWDNENDESHDGGQDAMQFMTKQEVADTLGITPDAVRKRATRGTSVVKVMDVADNGEALYRIIT